MAPHCTQTDKRTRWVRRRARAAQGSAMSSTLPLALHTDDHTPIRSLLCHSRIRRAERERGMSGERARHRHPLVRSRCCCRIRFALCCLCIPTDVCTARISRPFRIELIICTHEHTSGQREAAETSEEPGAKSRSAAGRDGAAAGQGAGSTRLDPLLQLIHSSLHLKSSEGSKRRCAPDCCDAMHRAPRCCCCCCCCCCCSGALLRPIRRRSALTVEVWLLEHVLADLLARGLERTQHRHKRQRGESARARRSATPN